MQQSTSTSEKYFSDYRTSKGTTRKPPYSSIITDLNTHFTNNYTYTDTLALPCGVMFPHISNANAIHYIYIYIKM
jgi:hypothetical protein